MHHYSIIDAIRSFEALTVQDPNKSRCGGQNPTKLNFEQALTQVMTATCSMVGADRMKISSK